MLKAIPLVLIHMLCNFYSLKKKKKKEKNIGSYSTNDITSSTLNLIQVKPKL